MSTRFDVDSRSSSSAVANKEGFKCDNTLSSLDICIFLMPFFVGIQNILLIISNHPHDFSKLKTYAYIIIATLSRSKKINAKIFWGLGTLKNVSHIKPMLIISSVYDISTCERFYRNALFWDRGKNVKLVISC